jgi:hypothetical protein
VVHFHTNVNQDTYEDYRHFRKHGRSNRERLISTRNSIIGEVQNIQHNTLELTTRELELIRVQESTDTDSKHDDYDDECVDNIQELRNILHGARILEKIHAGRRKDKKRKLMACLVSKGTREDIVSEDRYFDPG